jgi:hypothetical protein
MPIGVDIAVIKAGIVGLAIMMGYTLVHPSYDLEMAR